MNRSVCGGIAWSLVATRYHDGMVFQAGSPALLPSGSFANEVTRVASVEFFISLRLLADGLLTFC